MPVATRSKMQVAPIAPVSPIALSPPLTKEQKAEKKAEEKAQKKAQEKATREKAAIQAKEQKIITLAEETAKTMAANMPFNYMVIGGYYYEGESSQCARLVSTIEAAYEAANHKDGYGFNICGEFVTIFLITTTGSLLEADVVRR